jgi:hypothetical protein
MDEELILQQEASQFNHTEATHAGLLNFRAIVAGSTPIHVGDSQPSQLYERSNHGVVAQLEKKKTDKPITPTS